MLPKLDIPTYKAEIPSTKKVVEYRPFLVKEEKILLTMAESLDDGEENAEELSKEAIGKVIANCVITEGIDPKKLTEFDVDFLFLKIRAKSRGEVINPSFNCVNEVDGETCGHPNTVEINLDGVGVKFPEVDKSKVEVTSTVGIQFKYLDSATVAMHNKESDQVTKLFKLIVDSIDYIYDKETIYKASETPKSELLEFVENLTEESFNKVKEFFETAPAVRADVLYKCSKCGYEETIPFVGSESFFAFA